MSLYLFFRFALTLVNLALLATMSVFYQGLVHLSAHTSTCVYQYQFLFFLQVQLSYVNFNTCQLECENENITYKVEITMMEPT